MKLYHLIIAFVILTSVSLGAQINDRYIRIVGNAKQEYVARNMIAELSLSEVQPNEYRQTMYKPLETTIAETQEELRRIGYRDSDLVKDESVALTGFQKVRTEKYLLQLKSREDLIAISAITLEGFKVTGVRYHFDNPGPEAEENLALAAIDDAERKARRLAEEVGMRLGMVLNIEDRSSGCCREITETKSDKVVHTYKVNVTYALIN